MVTLLNNELVTNSDGKIRGVISQGANPEKPRKSQKPKMGKAKKDSPWLKAVKKRIANQKSL